MEARREVVVQLEGQVGAKKRLLSRLRVPRSSYYRWRQKLREGGPTALEKAPRKPGPVWNGLREREREAILKVAREYPDESARLLSIRLTDQGKFSVSEATVFRVLKRHGLVRQRPDEERPAAKEWHTKTTRPLDLVQSDGTDAVIPGRGRYKWIQVMDDYSRKVLAHGIHEDEGAEAVSAVAMEAAEAMKLAEWPEERPRPIFLSDNGAGYRSKEFKQVLRGLGIKPIHGRSHHPQTQGKSERLNRRIKSRIDLLVYENPDAMQKAFDEEIRRYNETPHEALKNVSPNEMYEGRQDEVLRRRAELKARTLSERRRSNMALAAERN